MKYQATALRQLRESTPRHIASIMQRQTVCRPEDTPQYVRMLRGEVPRLFDRDDKMVLGNIRELSRGDDVLVISSGICTEEAMRTARALKGKGISLAHLHVSTLKPFDPSPVLAAAAKAEFGVITLENHSVIGGLGSIVAEAMAEAGLGVKLCRLGLQDRYAHGASRSYLMREYGLDATALLSAIETLTGATFGIEPDELAEVELPTLGGAAKAEDL